MRTSKAKRNEQRTVQSEYPGRRVTLKVVKIDEDVYEIEMHNHIDNTTTLYDSKRIGGTRFNEFKAHQIARRVSKEKNRIV